jgi:beta-galactosidase
VELLLNNRSLGHQKRPSDASALHWEVDYVSGTLQAVGYKQEEPIAEDELRTAGKVARILLLPERTTITTGDDAVSVEAVAVDASGVRVPDADGEVEFSVTGPGQILATDNGSSTDHESFLMPRHRLYAGRAVVWLRATAVGTITLHASIPGLSAGSAVLAAVDAPAQKQVRSF